METGKTKVGVIGCGNISGVYLQSPRLFPDYEIAACADLDLERARAKADEHGIAKALTVEDLLGDPEIEIVIDLANPAAHAAVNQAALAAGKHVYTEKPLAITREDGRKTLAAAAARGLRLGSAPDTFLGGGLQTCRKLLDDGWIGRPIGAAAFMADHGMESWHPDPASFYQAGGGPMLDRGPYYVMALVSLLGPVACVSGAARLTFPERVITSKERYGQVFKVEVPTHITGIMEFASGAVATVITSFDVWASELPKLEIYGTEGTLSLPDPIRFGGPVRLKRAGAPDWSEIPLTHANTENCRGLGVADMARAIRTGRPHRANGDLAYHVLDAMLAFEQSSRSGRRIEIGSTCSRPAPLPLGLPAGVMDD